MMEDFKVDNFPMSSIETMESIISIMKNSICKISINNGQQGTGFLCNINMNDWDTLRSLITTDFLIDANDFAPGDKINISFDEGKINKEIIIEENRKIYTNQECGITFIEIKSKDGIKRESFLDIDENIYNNNPKEYLKRLPVFLLQYPNGDKIKKSEGLIIKIRDNNYTVEHLCKCDSCSSGGPLINFNNNKVVGIHKDFGNNGHQWNLGIFIKIPIEKFKEAINNFENNQNLRENNINNNNFMNNMFNNFMNFNNNMNMMNNNMNMMNMNNMNMMNMNNMNFNNNMNMMNNNMNNMMNNNNNMNMMNNFMNLNQMMNNMNLNNNINNMNNNNNMNHINYEEPGKDFLVKFDSSSGKSIKIKVSKNISIKKLIEIFCKNVGITENYYGNDIIFLHNAETLDFNSKIKLKSLSYKNQILVTVIDKNELLSRIINIHFRACNGYEKTIKASQLITFSELKKLYINNIGLEENIIGNEIYFLYNGRDLSKSKEKLNSLSIHEGSIIIVLDKQNIIDSIKDIHFQTTSGSETIIKAHCYTTIESLIKKYKEEIEVDENDNKEKLLFLFNGNRLKTNSKDREGIEKIMNTESPTILVVENNNIIDN